MVHDINQFIFCCVIIVFVVHTWAILNRRLNSHHETLNALSGHVKTLYQDSVDDTKKSIDHVDRLNTLECIVANLQADAAKNDRKIERTEEE